MKLCTRVLITIAVSALSAGLAGCQRTEGPAENAGKEIDKVMEKAGHQIEKAAEKIRDAAKGATK
jgi:predicted small secreted protein